MVRGGFSRVSSTGISGFGVVNRKGGFALTREGWGELASGVMSFRARFGLRRGMACAWFAVPTFRGRQALGPIQARWESNMKSNTVGKARRGYVLTRETANYGYSLLHLSIVIPARWDDGRAEFTSLWFSWQSTDKPGDRSEWYAFHCEIQRRDKLEELIADAKLAQLINKAMTGADIGQSPADYVAQLGKLGFVRYVMDRRVSPDLVRLEKVLPVSYSRWLPDYNRLGWDSCIVSTVQPNEAKAQADCLAQLASRANHFGGMDEVAQRTKEFLDAGQPVMVDHHSTAPDITPTEVLIQSPKDRDAEEQAAEERTREAYDNAKGESATAQPEDTCLAQIGPRAGD